MAEAGKAASKPTVDAARERESLMRAMLELSGERGYRQVSLRFLLQRSGGDASQFHRHFAGRLDCFAAAYQLEAERLVSALLEACARRPHRRDGVNAAIDELLRFCAARPATARAILCEAQVAGGAALAKHEELLERLSRALHAACHGSQNLHPHSLPTTDQSRSPRTADFIVGAVEEAVKVGLSEPSQLASATPELIRVAVDPYLGQDAAAADPSGPPQP